METSHIVSITDHIQFPEIEQCILGPYLAKTLDYESTILLVWHENINSIYLNKFPYLKAIVRYGVGYDNIDLVECKRRNIVVCNTPDYGVEEVADTAIALILNLNRNIKKLESYALNNPGYWTGNPKPPGCKRLRNCSVGILGLGRIGCNLGVKIKPFVDSVAFYDPNISIGFEKSLDLARVHDLNDLLEMSDIVSVNTTLNDSTLGLIDENFLNKMKPNSLLINVSRGGIFGNTSSILSALNTGHLAGFATDVWPNEPPLESDSIFSELTTNNKLKHRTIFTPHTAYYSDEAENECRTKAASNCLRIIQNLAPFNIIRA
ncbi:lactate dehydrogenase [bacterium]|nr:lactate dehydrogenase [bacterium]